MKNSHITFHFLLIHWLKILGNEQISDNFDQDFLRGKNENLDNIFYNY